MRHGSTITPSRGSDPDARVNSITRLTKRIASAEAAARVSPRSSAPVTTLVKRSPVPQVVKGMRGVVRSAFAVTTLLAVVFGLLAVLYPAFFASMWRVLAVSLFIALIWALVNMVTGFLSSTMVWLDWLVVLMFCCYVGFDVSLARNRPKTLDNAVDSACGLYLDLINLFLRLLIIFGRNRD